MQYGGNSAAPIFYRAVAYHGILSYICRMNEKLLFRRARPADTERIMEIIRQAQAQMRALGSLQWQDGYPGSPPAAITGPIADPFPPAATDGSSRNRRRERARMHGEPTARGLRGSGL